MTRTSARVSKLVLFLAVLWISPAQGQEKELPLGRILNPLPDFDPFEKSPERPQFFPDQVDKRSREVAVDALLNRKGSLEDHLKFFKNEDARLQKQHQTSTGLTDHVQDLLNGTIADRERYLNAQRDALKNSPSPQRKKYLESIINHDDLNQSDQYLRQSSTNYWGGMFNRLLSSVDLVGVASGNYIGAAVDTAISQVYALAERDMPVEERRALARDLDHLKRYPDDPRNATILKRVETLDKKKKAALVKKQLDKVKEALAKKDLDRAAFHAQLASFLDADSRQTAASLERISTLRQELEENKKITLSAVTEPHAASEQQQDTERLLRALTLRDPHLIERAAVELDKKYRGKPLADSARDAEAVAMEIKGWHEAAKKTIQELSRSAVTPDSKQRATALLQSPEYNLLGSFQDARSERRLQTAKYILLGEDFLKKNLLYTAGAMAAAGPAGAATLGTVNAIMMGSNLVQVLTNNPISQEPVINAGVAYVRSHPNSESAAEVYRVLAEAFEERGMLDKALSYYELSGTASKEKIASLKDKAAQTFLAAAKNKDRATQVAYFKTILDEFPESRAAAEATKKLAELVKDENRGLRMSKQFLMENPELYGPRGLGLKASLFDGKGTNMELAERGVNLLENNQVLLYYQTPWGVQTQSYDLPQRIASRFLITLREKNYEIAKADVDQRAKDSIGGIKNLPMPIVRAERERRMEKPESRDDSSLSLLREAGAPRAAFPKVLDYELLSENERDPGSKYKLPPIQGTVSASRFSMSGTLPTGLWGNQLAIGTDHRSPFAGVQLPIPLLQGFIPIDFMVQGRPGGLSVYPRIHTGKTTGADPELYR